MEEEPPESMMEKLLNVISEQIKTVVEAIGELRKTVITEFRRSTRLTWLGIVITSLGFIATVIFGILPLIKSVSNIQSGVNQVSGRVEQVEKGILVRQFTITTPVDGATVDRIELIRGFTPFPEMTHYLVVTPVKTGEDLIQDTPVKVSATGLWSGRAIFGAAIVGTGEQFIVRALATKSVGLLIEVPKDAIFSELITVTRKK